MPKGVELDDFYILEYPDWINVIAITEEGDFVLERQYRHGTQTVEYEICAGVIEKGEEPLVLKTDDIHPPKTGISVHFSCSLS